MMAAHAHAITLALDGWVPVLIAAAFVLAWLGFAALSLSQERHHEAVFGATAIAPSRARWLRAIGSLLLVFALLACLTVWGPAVGLAAWLGVLAIGAMAQALLLSWHSSRAH